MRSLTLLTFVLFGILILLSQSDGRRRRRRDTMNERLAAVNSEFHLYDAPVIQRLIRQVSEHEDEDSEEEDEVEKHEIVRRHAQAPPAPPLPTSPAPPTVNASVSVSGETKVALNVSTTVTPPTTKRPSPPLTTEQIEQGTLYLPPGYNRLEIPKIKIGRTVIAVPVIVYLNIRSIRDYDELEQTITLEMDLVVEWFDGLLFDITKVNPRVAPIQKTLNPDFLKKIWHPDIYMDDLISVDQPRFMAQPLTLKFSPNTGFMSYTSRIAAKANCDMHFHHYPADTQVCEFHLKSYAFTSGDLDLSWLLHGVYLVEPDDPNFDFQVSEIDTIKTMQKFNNPKNETHDTLVFTILARRKLSYQLVQTYLPSVFFIIITWLCFLIPSKFIEARIGISMTTLLTLTAMFASVRESTPIVSYVKAIDLWMVFCIFFVFLTLLEFSILIWMRSIREDAIEALNTAENTDEGSPRRKSISDTLSHHSTTSSTLRAHGLFSELVEKYAFVIFSIIFIVFNIIYWTWLLQSAKFFEWNVNATHTNVDDD